MAAQLRAAGFEVEVIASAPRPRPADGDGQRGVGDSGGVTRPPPQAGAVNPLTFESGEIRAAANREQQQRADQADLRVETTHGSPYDPHQALVAKFGPSRRSERPRFGVDERLHALVTAATRATSEEALLPLYAQIQALLDREALIVPLFAPWRVALHVAGVEGIRLGSDVYSVDLTGLRRVVR